jgi:hypothetical protein
MIRGAAGRRKPGKTGVLSSFGRLKGALERGWSLGDEPPQRPTEAAADQSLRLNGVNLVFTSK